MARPGEASPDPLICCCAKWETTRLNARIVSPTIIGLSAQVGADVFFTSSNLRWRKVHFLPFVTVIVTVAGVLSTTPSLTTRLTT